jgi:hypothetical protein
LSGFQVQSPSRKTCGKLRAHSVRAAGEVEQRQRGGLGVRLVRHQGAVTGHGHGPLPRVRANPAAGGVDDPQTEIRFALRIEGVRRDQEAAAVAEDAALQPCASDATLAGVPAIGQDQVLAVMVREQTAIRGHLGARIRQGSKGLEGR